MLTRKIATALFLLVISIDARAVPVEFEFDWTGENEYTLSGMLSFDNSLLGTGVITQNSLLSFFMEGFQSGVSLGTFGGIPESLFFDTDGLFFPVGVNADSSRNTQGWNFLGGPGIGFLSGRFTQSMLLDGVFIDGSGFRVEALTVANSRLTVTQVAEPGALALLGIGFAGIGLLRRRKKA